VAPVAIGLTDCEQPTLDWLILPSLQGCCGLLKRAPHRSACTCQTSSDPGGSLELISRIISQYRNQTNPHVYCCMPLDSTFKPTLARRSAWRDDGYAKGGVYNNIRILYISDLSVRRVPWWPRSRYSQLQPSRSRPSTMGATSICHLQTLELVLAL
jgi:hypothetical protein